MENVKEEFLRSAKLMRSFANVQKNMMRLVQKNAVKHGISVTQYTILMTILPYKEMTQKSLGEKTFLPKSTLSQALDGLVQQGLLIRQQVEDNRREIQLTICEKGEDFFRSIHLHKGGIHEIFQAAIASLTEEQYDNLLETHLQITTYLETQEVN